MKLLRQIKEFFFSPIPEPKIGSVWTFQVTVVDVKDGWVRYRFSSGRLSQMEIMLFTKLYEQQSSTS